MLPSLLGGLGLFLLGMILMTDGLKAAAGDRLRATLAHLTGGPGRAVFAGVATTALVQSSSATVLTTIGFVSAGLLTFPQAVGVILGANLGTTSTGWLVSIVGLKLNLGAVALPVVGLGAILRLVGRGRAAALGSALAGFGLVFYAITLLQSGMAGLATYLSPDALPGSTTMGRLGLVGVGLAMTVVMQSSSAAMATTLTALHAGTIDLAQGAALVIGQNVGTTVTAALGAIGASVSAKRTALVHIVFNAMAGTLAFATLPVFLLVSGRLEIEDAATALAAFHTAFNLVGVALVLPFTAQLTRAVARILPERGRTATRHLDDSVAEVPAVAVEAARRATADVAARIIDLLPGYGPAEAGRVARLAEAGDSLLEIRRFLTRVRTSTDTPAEHQRHQSVLHAVDHLERLIEALQERAPGPTGDTTVDETWTDAAPHLAAARAWLSGDGEVFETGPLAAAAAAVVERRRPHRQAVLADAARGVIDPDQALARVDAMRRAERLLHHVWRAVAHLSGNGAA